MARIHGKGAKVLLGERDATGDAITMTPEFTAQTHDTTTMGDQYLENIAGLLGWEASFEAFYDPDAGGIGRQLEAIGEAIAATSIMENAGSPSGSELLSNVGFETAGAGGADVFGSWSETASDGAIADEGAVTHGGSHAAKLTAGAGKDTLITQNVTVTPGQLYEFSFWNRGDTSLAGRLAIYDLTNVAAIIAATSTGITAAAYSQYRIQYAAPAACVSVRLTLQCPDALGGIAYFDDVSHKAVNNRGIVLSPAVLTKRSDPKVVADMMKISGTLAGNGRCGILGRMLHPLGQETVTATGTILDNGASSANGGRANLHVTAITGSWTMKVQHSADAVTWADLITFTQATAAGGATSESKTVTGSINRYLRTVATEDVAGSVTFALTAARY